jgi:hypothetical protein
METIELVLDSKICESSDGVSIERMDETNTWLFFRIDCGEYPEFWFSFYFDKNTNQVYHMNGRVPTYTVLECEKRLYLRQTKSFDYDIKNNLIKIYHKHMSYDNFHIIVQIKDLQFI